MHQALEALDRAQLVLRDVQLLQQGAAVQQRHHLPNRVERQVQNLQVLQVRDVLNHLDVVVVQFQLLQVVLFVQTFDFRHQTGSENQRLRGCPESVS